MTRLQIDRFLMEINYLDDLLNVVYWKFLNAIDHIEYHPTFQNELSYKTRSKCSIFFSKTGFYNTFNHSLSPTEELFLDKLLMALENMNSTITQKFRLTEITLTVWFCLKHRKSMTTLLKIALPLTRKIQNDPKTIERLVQ